MTRRSGERGRLWQAIALAAVALLAGLATVSCGGGGSTSQADQPIFPGGCPPVSAPTGGGAGVVSRVPIKVVKQGPAAIALAPVCIAGHGPYAFIVDSGAGTSAFDTQLTKQLHLAANGPTQSIGAVNCATKETPVSGPSWSIGNVALTPQTVSSIDIPGFGLRNAASGLLGSDVLSRFGAVQLDYHQQSMAFPGPEGPPPSPGTNVHGPTSVDIPPSISLASPSTSIPLVVAQDEGETVALVPMRIRDQGPFSFILDTGSSVSSVDPQVAQSIGLPQTGKPQQTSSVGCAQTTRQVQSGSWSAGTVPLPPQPLLKAVPIAGASGEINGLLGSDVLHGFGAVVIAYSAGTLLVTTNSR